MAHRPSSTARRRARLAFHVNQIEQVESRTLATESLGVLLPSLSMVAAMAQVEEAQPSTYAEWAWQEDRASADESLPVETQPEGEPAEPQADAAPSMTTVDRGTESGGGSSQGGITAAVPPTVMQATPPIAAPPTVVRTDNLPGWNILPPNTPPGYKYQVMSGMSLLTATQRIPFTSNRAGAKPGESIHVTTGTPGYPIGIPVGSYAAEDCIGVMVTSPSRSDICVYHFYPTQAPGRTLLGDVAGFRGAHVAIFGGNNAQASNETLKDVMRFLDAEKDQYSLAIDGYSNTDGLWTWNGQYVLMEGDTPSDNQPPLPPAPRPFQ
jgi:hypothetical protein